MPGHINFVVRIISQKLGLSISRGDGYWNSRGTKTAGVIVMRLIFSAFSGW